MIVNGQYTSAEIFAKHIEEDALQWIELQWNHPVFKGILIVQMPDVHAISLNMGRMTRRRKAGLPSIAVPGILVSR